jgi:[ribosomal protein S5]-alanine N-acetyltransferase
MPLINMNTSFRYSLEGQESERLLFRKITPDDFDTWLPFCKDPDSLTYIFSQQQLLIKDPVERCKIWFDRVFNRYNQNLGGMNALINKKTNVLVGQCGLLIQTIDGKEELEIGYSLLPEHRGKGYALEAAKKCRDFAFEQHFSESLISMIHVDNLASQKVAINNGMILDKTVVKDGDSLHIFRLLAPTFVSR